MNELDKRQRRRMAAAALAKRHRKFCERLSKRHCHFIGLTPEEVGQSLRDGCNVDDRMWMDEDAL